MVIVVCSICLSLCSIGRGDVGDVGRCGWGCCWVCGTAGPGEGVRARKRTRTRTRKSVSVTKSLSDERAKRARKGGREGINKGGQVTVLGIFGDKQGGGGAVVSLLGIFWG